MLCLCLAHSLPFSSLTHLSLFCMIVMCWQPAQLTFKCIYLKACSLACNTLTHLSTECETEQTHRKRPVVHSNVPQPLALEVIWAITQFHRGNLLNGALRWIKMCLCGSLGNNISFFIKVFSLQPLCPTWILHIVHDVLEMKLMLNICHVTL